MFALITQSQCHSYSQVLITKSGSMQKRAPDIWAQLDQELNSVQKMFSTLWIFFFRLMKTPQKKRESMCRPSDKGTQDDLGSRCQNAGTEGWTNKIGIHLIYAYDKSVTVIMSLVAQCSALVAQHFAGLPPLVVAGSQIPRFRSKIPKLMYYYQNV